MVGSIKEKFASRTSGNIVLVIVISAVFLFVIGGVSAGMALGAIRDHTGETPMYGGNFGNAEACYLTDEYFSDPAEMIDASYARSKLNISSSVPDEKITKVIETTRTAGFNPALALATWNAESSYGTDPNNKSDSTGKYEFGYILKNWGGIDKQLEGYISTLERTKNNEGSYGTKSPGEPMQVYWRNIYTPASDKANDVPEDRKNICIVIKKLVPDQVEQPQLSSGIASYISGSLDFRGTGPGLNGVIGLWQSLDETFESLGGKSESNIRTQLTYVKFMGVGLNINKLIVAPLKAVEKDIIASGVDYKFRQRDTGAFNWRVNTNDESKTSPHATGLAIDVNWETNPNLKPRPAGCAPRDPSCCPTDLPKEVTDAFQKNGFFWGAKFLGVCDSMHFQYGGNY